MTTKLPRGFFYLSKYCQQLDIISSIQINAIGIIGLTHKFPSSGIPRQTGHEGCSVELGAEVCKRSIEPV